METHAPTPSSASPAPSKRTLIVSLIGLGMVTAAAITTYKLWPERLPNPQGDPVETVKFITSDKFEKLPLEKQIPYVDELMNKGFGKIALYAIEAGLTQEQGQRGLQNAMQAGMEVRWGKHLNNWLKLDKKGKEQYVKDVVAKMPKRPPGFDPRTNRRGPVMTAEQQKRFIESMSPDRRAAMAEFMSAVRAAHGDGGR